MKNDTKKFCRDIIKRILKKDPFLTPYADSIAERIFKIKNLEQRLTGGGMSLRTFATGHEYFGLHLQDNGWTLRELAPNASEIYLVGDLSGWLEKEEFKLKRINRDGVWEIILPFDALSHQDLYRFRIHWPGGAGDRIPAYARRVMQDPVSLIFNAQVWHPPAAYQWICADFTPAPEALFIYEAHIGMALEEGRVGTFKEFSAQIIPRIARAGYNAIQLMAIQEHPYYASFGYQVSSFFAPSSRFGTPDELKGLIDNAHEYGLAVIMDIIHSHAVSNEVEGLSLFDGTPYLYFHEGARGFHEAWNSRCFDYGKDQALHFLLSNCRYWLEEFRFDGFRFDGVTSMLYHDHGLGKAFTSYDYYFNDNVDQDAYAYLALANRLIHDIRPDAIVIAEDISGMPGLAVTAAEGGAGFDYRYAMGVPDNWIRLLKDVPDEDWHMGGLWHELTNRRKDEKTISYAESHDQALVGDKSIIFRLIDSDMYDHMHIDDDNIRVARGLALHKMIRLITLATAGSGYMNFIGNEFGHPEWVDFPREGNGWSYHYARRQWHLQDDPDLKYKFLAEFDRNMISMARTCKILDSSDMNLLYKHDNDKIIAFERAGLVFVFNFHPRMSWPDYHIPSLPGQYRMILDSDNTKFGGYGRLTAGQHHFTISDKSECGDFLSLYIPSRTGIVLQSI
jgi:1,4-alpha-glucan branching enzyme